MSVNVAACCCGGDADCFFGVNANDGATACGHSITEELIFKKERKRSFTQTTNYSYYEGIPGTPTPCYCAGDYVTSTYFPSSPDVEVKYSHYNRDPDELWAWYYRTFDTLFPDCLDHCCTSDDPADDTYCCGTGQNDSSACANDYFDYLGRYCSKYQKQVISQGDAPAKTGSGEDCEYGNQYKFLQGIANMTTDRYWKNWGVNTHGQVIYEGLTNKFAETIVAVFHREHWYEQYYNSLSQADNEHASDSDNAAARCSVPRWWLFGCTATFLTAHDIMENSGLSDPSAFLIKIVYDGLPVTTAEMETLEANGVLHPVKDWEQPGGEVIKKDLKYYNSSGTVETEVTEYFFGVEGGWSYVCNNFATGNDDDNMETYFPQVARRHTEEPTPCSLGVTACHTAAPYPSNNAVCVTNSWGSTAPSGCNPCESTMGDCLEPVVSSCSGCWGDVLIGSCRGVWAQAFAYYLGSSTTEYPLNYKCGSCSVTGPTGTPCDGVTSKPWNAYLCRIAKEGDKCNWPELPDFMAHRVNSLVSGSMRNRTSDLNNLCCGARGTYSLSEADCPAEEPTSADCDDPPTWGPDI